MNQAWLVRTLLFSLLLLAGCGENDRTINIAENAVRQSLRDGESAEFRGEFVVTTTDKDGVQDHVVCGEVNAKNGFGGYTGFERFIVHVIGNDFTVGPEIEEGQNAHDSGNGGTYFETMMWQKECVKR